MPGKAARMLELLPPVRETRMALQPSSLIAAIWGVSRWMEDLAL